MAKAAPEFSGAAFLKSAVICGVNLLFHALFDGDRDRNGSAYHGVVAHRKSAIFIVLIRLKQCQFLSKISVFLAEKLLFLPFIVFICFNAFLPEMLN